MRRGANHETKMKRRTHSPSDRTERLAADSIDAAGSTDAAECALGLTRVHWALGFSALRELLAKPELDARMRAEGENPTDDRVLADVFRLLADAIDPPDVRTAESSNPSTAHQESEGVYLRRLIASAEAVRRRMESPVGRNARGYRRRVGSALYVLYLGATWPLLAPLIRKRAEERYDADAAWHACVSMMRELAQLELPVRKVRRVGAEGNAKAGEILKITNAHWEKLTGVKPGRNRFAGVIAQLIWHEITKEQIKQAQKYLRTTS